MKILVVEDYEDTRELIGMMLRARGHEVVEAADGLEAVSLSESERPELVLMDLNLPVLDGWEATRRIRSRSATSHIHVIAMSAQCSGEWRDRALAAGAIECVQKPVDFRWFDSLLGRSH